MLASGASVYCGPPLQRGSGGASPLPVSDVLPAGVDRLGRLFLVFG